MILGSKRPDTIPQGPPYGSLRRTQLLDPKAAKLQQPPTRGSDGPSLDLSPIYTTRALILTVPTKPPPNPTL